MRLARVIGNVVLSRKLDALKAGSLLIADVFDRKSLTSHKQCDGQPQATSKARMSPMPESLVVFDELGAGKGDIIAISEGGEAAAPFYPDRVAVDAYCAAIIDTVNYTEMKNPSD